MSPPTLLEKGIRNNRDRRVDRRPREGSRRCVHSLWRWRRSWCDDLVSHRVCHPPQPAHAALATLCRPAPGVPRERSSTHSAESKANTVPVRSISQLPHRYSTGYTYRPPTVNLGEVTETSGKANPGRCDGYTVKPPSTSRTAPVTYRASSLARKRTIAAISSG